MNNNRKFWERCKRNYAHLKENWEIKPGSRRELYFNTMFLDHYNCNDKTIIDYGCGAGYFGLYMFEYHNIKEYIGIDIAERSIIAAKKILKDYNAKFYMTPISFKDLNCNMFISSACIQHFMDEAYLKDFLKNINDSDIDDVILNIRHGKETKFSNAYKSFERDKGRACLTNEKYISNELSNYELYKKSDIHKISSSQYLLYRLK